MWTRCCFGVVLHREHRLAVHGDQRRTAVHTAGHDAREDEAGGGDVYAAGRYGTEAVQLAEAAGALLATTLPARGMFVLRPLIAFLLGLLLAVNMVVIQRAM